MKNKYFPDFSCTHGRMCVYGRYAPDYYIIDYKLSCFNYCSSLMIAYTDFMYLR